MIEVKKSNLKPVSDEEMQEIYQRIATPKKLGAMIKWEGYYLDCPGVFKKDGMFYMYFISIADHCETSGYETHLAKSSDLIHWEYVGKIFERDNEDHWYSRQCAGYPTFMDIDYDGTYELQKVNDSYYMSFLAGNKDGYEPYPFYIGMAKTSDPLDPDAFTRLPDPIFTPQDEDARLYETTTLYKSYMFEDKRKVTGYKYVCAYNAAYKGKGPDQREDHRERIFLAVSNDGENWERYGEKAIIDLVTEYPSTQITGDPQIILMDDIYVMFFFRYEYGKHAYDMYACSRDLVNWNICMDKPLITSEYDWENEHAHKPWFIRHEGKNYHFYCAVNSKNERYIALAVSE